MRNSKLNLASHIIRKTTFLLATLLVAIVLITVVSNKSLAAEKYAWFWCAAHSTESDNLRNFYSNVFKGNINHRSRYERAFQSVVSTRILKSSISGNVLCVFNEIKGEARREQNDYALDRKIRLSGTMEFLDWSY
ncbi:MAG: hypothetical protein HAW61_01775 [Candidatus Portiera sp.]|nr:hypothetical protein [Portiera sp.]